MKRTTSIAVLFLSLFMITSCTDGINIDVNDPQHIEFIEVAIDQNLIEAFGEENIHFGHTPPSLEGISFKVVGMDYDTCIRYIFNVNPNEPPILSHTDPPTYDGSTNYHHFYNHIDNIASHKLKTIDSHNDTYTRENDVVYVIGNANSNQFTAYYEEELQEEGSGYPSNGILVSGKLEFTTDTIISANDTVYKKKFIGVKDYRLGKKILRYKERPSIPSYAEGTIEVKKHPGLAPAVDWDK